MGVFLEGQWVKKIGQDGFRSLDDTSALPSHPPHPLLVTARHEHALHKDGGR